MKEPTRMREGNPKEMSVMLLRSWQPGEPSAERVRCAAGALGLGGLGVTAVSGMAEASVVVGTTVKTSAWGLGMVAIKWLGVGLVSGLAAAASVRGVVTARDIWEPSMVRAPMAAVPSQPRSFEPPPGIGPKEQGMASVASAELPGDPARHPPATGARTRAGSDPLPAIAPREAVASSASESVRVSYPRAVSLSEEVGAVERARQALAARDPAEALTALAGFERLGPSATLRPEATLLRIQALRQLGRRNQARTLAEQFLAAHGHSPQSDQLRSFLAEPPDP